ncbi:MAG: hypothetical protein MAG794_00458 [Gammaproteobacteria bacterium]|nr:hypothetical protein [Gammaproteobacteria bacterium]
MSCSEKALPGETPYRNGTTHVILEPLNKCGGNVFKRPKAGPVGVEGGVPGIIRRPLRIQNSTFNNAVNLAGVLCSSVFQASAPRH